MNLLAYDLVGTHTLTLPPSQSLTDNSHFLFESLCVCQCMLWGWDLVVRLDIIRKLSSILIVIGLVLATIHLERKAKADGNAE